MTVPQKILNGFFQSVTVRTAGFASINQADLTESGKAVSVVLMLIGGSSGSTAGGVNGYHGGPCAVYLVKSSGKKHRVCI